LGGLVAAAATPAQAASSDPLPAGPLPPGTPLRVAPLLAYAIPQPREKTSWRSYGGLKTREDVDAEVRRLEQELKTLVAGAEFPIQMAPVQLVGSDAEAAAAAAAETDVLLVFASGGPQHWLEQLAASGKPNILFVRHRSGPVYLWYEIATGDCSARARTVAEPNMTVDDVVVDEYGRRALAGCGRCTDWKNTKGTKCLAIGGLQAYSKPGTEQGPEQAKQRWGMDIIPVTDADLVSGCKKARDDAAVMQEAEQQAPLCSARPTSLSRPSDGSWSRRSWSSACFRT